MSKGPEANFWNSIRQNLPKKCIATRIENQHGGGVPDVHILIDSMPVWIELKVTNGKVKSLGSRSLFLFRGSEALPLARGGLSEAQGSRFEGLAPCISALRLASLEHYSEVLRLAPCLAPCASMEEGGE
jgi:hypothetical protein